MQFVDDGLVEWPGERPVIFPVVRAGIDDSRPERCGDVLSWGSCAPSIPERRHHTACVGIEQCLVAVKAERWACRSRGPERVRRAGAEARDEGVPEVEVGS